MTTSFSFEHRHTTAARAEAKVPVRVDLRVVVPRSPDQYITAADRALADALGIGQSVLVRTRSGAIAACVLVALAGCGSTNRVETAPTNTLQSTSSSTPDPPQSWCVSVSRQAAILAFQHWLLESSMPHSATGDSLTGSLGRLDIKLITWSEWSAAPDPDHERPSRWWLIEVHGGGLPDRVAGKRASWLLAWVNARSGAVRPASQGTGAPPSRWGAVADHSKLCPSR
jgi:hypothetical protein